MKLPTMLARRGEANADAGRSALRSERAAELVPQARLSGPMPWVIAIMVALTAIAAAVLLAARTALGTNRDTIEIVHLLGGTDAQIARIFQRSITFDAAGGGAVGLGLATVTIIVLGQRFAGLGSGLVDGGSLDWLDWLAIALVPLAVIALAALTARLTVLRALRTML